jgi:protein involved in polysaccharide export with SLBB domain
VLNALPGRSIEGQRLVRPDGKILLGFYGEIYVAGLTIAEAKAKIVEHLRQFLSDEALGLIVHDPVTGEPRKDSNGQFILRDRKDSDGVFVDVTAYNSQNYYVQGAVKNPGKIPVTGHDTVLDAIDYAGSLTPQADHDNVVLYRKEKNGTLQRLPINVDQIMMGDDPTTNYQLLPGDRLVIPAKPGARQDDESPLEQSPAAGRVRSIPNDAPLRPERRAPAARTEPAEDQVQPPRRDVDRDADSRALIRMERRLSEVERKLDRVLEALERRQP